jgi:hypothetical protein
MIRLCIVGYIGISQLGFSEDASKAARQKSDFAVSLQYLLISGGGAISYYASKDAVLELAAGMDILPYVGYQKFGLKKFYGNSFYSTQSIITFTGLENLQRQYGVDLNFGNEWQWKSGFQFGCDWLGAIFRISRNKYDTDSVSSEEQDNESKESSGVFEQPLLWSNIKPYALRFRMGYAF